MAEETSLWQIIRPHTHVLKFSDPRAETSLHRNMSETAPPVTHKNCNPSHVTSPPAQIVLKPDMEALWSACSHVSVKHKILLSLFSTELRLSILFPKYLTLPMMIDGTKGLIFLPPIDLGFALALHPRRLLLSSAGITG